MSHDLVKNHSDSFLGYNTDIEQFLTWFYFYDPISRQLTRFTSTFSKCELKKEFSLGSGERPPINSRPTRNMIICHKRFLVVHSNGNYLNCFREKDLNSSEDVAKPYQVLKTKSPVSLSSFRRTNKFFRFSRSIQMETSS